MKRILLAIERGAASWEATRLAVHMAPKLKAPITVLTVLVPEGQRGESKDQCEREYTAAHELVDDAVKDLLAAGVKAKGEVRSCNPGEVAGEILATAIRLSADLIVMGSRARGELTGLLLGSVSHKVAMDADCPVVIVPTGATRLTPRRILLVIDGEGDAQKPVAATAALARAAKASVEVVCVGHTLGDTDHTAESALAANPDEAAVAAAVSALEKAGVEVQSRMIDNVRGLAPEIAREVMATGADMIVIGSRAMGWISGDITAGTAESVIHRTQRPVVVAPSRSRS